ncbi:MAG: dihydroorotate dehydrogenase [Candidatus Falkowbacteria bacterium]
MRKNFRTTVITCKGNSTTGVFRLLLNGEQRLEAKPGQFVMLESRCADKIWRRPFSVCAQGGSFVVEFKIRGRNTEYYAKMKSGDELSVTGPLGNPIFIDPGCKKVILVVGGTGKAGLMLLASELKYSPVEVTFIYGVKNRREITEVDLLRYYGCQVKTITENEDRGLATDLLVSELETGLYDADSQIIACGPNAMLEEVAGMALMRGIHCQVVMETLMACGFGSCKGCAIPKKDSQDYFHLCQDGPALPGDQVDWKKLRRPSMIVPAEKRKPVEEINMETVLIGQYGRKLVLPTPIILDSGTFHAAAAIDGPVDLTFAAAIQSKGTTYNPRFGNPTPRVCEVPMGMLNSIGLENVGLKEFIKTELPLLRETGKNVIANISGETVEEFALMSWELAEAGVEAVVLNISCPNKEKGGQNFGLSEDITFNVVQKVRQKVGDRMFIIVKLSPMAPDVVKVGKAAEMAGADALIGFNTYLAMKIDLATRRPAIANIFGGESGPSARARNLRLVHLLCQAVKIPVIASTGIESGSDAAEYMIAGAQAVAIGTGLLSNPNVVPETFYELREIVANYGMADIQELVGSLIL